MFQNNQYYLRNVNLPNANYMHAFTQDEINEYKKCMNDPVYFAKNYIQIVNVDLGLTKFDMWDFQERIMNTLHNNRFVICKLPRQTGKTTTTVSFLLHYILFNRNVSVAILANKAATAREILGRLQLAFEYLPRFLQQGVVEWNKGSIELANGSRILAESTTGSSIRGRSFNIIFLDEFAFVPNNLAEEFFASTYPTISSGKTTKVFIVSTPNGINHFYKMWNSAVDKLSDYVPIEVHWSEVPGRDEAWKEQTIRNTSPEQFEQEFECSFLGGQHTLINPAKLKSLKFGRPIVIEDTFQAYELPIKDNTYVITCDVSRGLGLDYTAFSIFDVSSLPYKQIARYKNNKVSPLLLPTILVSYARRYNDAFILIETNDIGQQVADIVHHELAYENLFKIRTKGKAGQQISDGFVSGINKVQYGLKTSTPVKRIGCANLKTIVESDKLMIQDSETIMELTTFAANKQTYAAEEGNNDDLAMTLVLFGWLTAQKYFRENVQSDIRKTLQEEQLRLVDEDFVPFGIIDRFEEEKIVDRNGDVWVEVERPFF